MQAEPLPSMAVAELPVISAAPPHYLARMRGAALRSIGRHVSMLGTIATSLSVVGLNAIQGVLLARLLGPAGRGAVSAPWSSTRRRWYSSASSDALTSWPAEPPARATS